MDEPGTMARNVGRNCALSLGLLEVLAGHRAGGYYPLQRTFLAWN